MAAALSMMVDVVEGTTRRREKREGGVGREAKTGGEEDQQRDCRQTQAIRSRNHQIQVGEIE